MNVHIYQIWYDEKSRPDENSGIEAFDCRDKPEFLKREIAHLIRFYDEIVKHADNDCYFALFSPRFNEKTGLTIKQVKDFVSNNPNQDIYLFNPFPMHVYLDMNVWEHGERRHTGLKQLTQYLFDAAGVDFDINTKHRNNINNTVYCNYWVASKPFLDHFISFIRQLDLTVDTMPKNQKNNYFIETTYCTKASFYPFIFERIISTFLLIHSDYSVKPYIYNVGDAPFKTLKRIDREFYQNGCREIFDNFEKEVNNQESLEKGVKLLKETLRPNISLFPFDILNRWASSILKRLNLWRMPRILEKLYEKK